MCNNNKYEKMLKQVEFTLLVIEINELSSPYSQTKMIITYQSNELTIKSKM